MRIQNISFMILSAYLCFATAWADEALVMSPPFSIEGVDPYSEDLYLYLSDANKVHLAISIEGDGQILLLNDQPPTPEQLKVLKKALADLQDQRPIDPQASQAIDYIIQFLSK
ncbi:peptidoglycan recognition protein family protein [Motilimonas cestriensis]|uniref:peptidoglycan recognition protein family protein n=1 Tax=Motilimonas cestriensis TaxID=2742685 RepID=UPI003DA20357